MTPNGAAPHLEEIPHSRPTLGEPDRAALMETLATGFVAEGTQARAFERRMADYLSHDTAVSASSGRMALLLALRAAGVGAGDEVIIPTYVCPAVWEAVEEVGATPILADVDEDWCMSSEDVERVLTPRTSAIIVVHTFGIKARVIPFLDLGIPVIEDCAQAIPFKNRGPEIGREGHMAVFSFHATKIMTTGEGGMVMTSDPRLSDRLRALSGSAPEAGTYRYPLSDLQAALGLAQLSRLEGFLQEQQRIADSYFSDLSGLGARLPTHVRDRSIFFRFPLRIDYDFDEAKAAFADHGIHVRRGVDTLLHREYAVEGRFPSAEARYAETLSIPIYPSLSSGQQKRVTAACREVLA